MNEQENIKLAERAYETFTTGDAESFVNLFSEDVSWNAPEIENLPLQMKFSGRDKLAAVLSEHGKHEEYLKMEPTEFIAQGDKVVVLGNLVARSKQTNNQYETDFVHVFTVKDGKFVAFLEFLDNAAAGRAHTAAKSAK